MNKSVELHRSLTVILAPAVLAVVAKRVGCSVCCLRCVGLLCEVDTNVYKITIRTLSKLIGYTYNTIFDGVAEARVLGLIAPRKNGAGLVLAFAALGISDQVKRAESEARCAVLRAELPKNPRKYTKRASPAGLV